MRRKRLRRPHLIAILILAALLFGFLYSRAYNAYLRSIYPREFGESVASCAEKYDIPEQVIYAVIKIESDFNADATSRAGAVGLMQLMPGTFRWLTDDVTREKLPDGMISDPEANIRHGSCYLALLYSQYGDWQTAFAAYNAGQGRVNDWLGDTRYSDGSGKLTYIPYEETRNYVEYISGAIKMYTKLYYDDRINGNTTE